MSLFVVGVIVERTQSVDLLIGVDAESLAEAQLAAVNAALKFSQAEIRTALRGVDWESGGDLTIRGASDEEFGTDLYSPDIVVKVVGK